MFKEGDKVKLVPDELDTKYLLSARNLIEDNQLFDTDIVLNRKLIDFISGTMTVHYSGINTFIKLPTEISPITKYLVFGNSSLIKVTESDSCNCSVRHLWTYGHRCGKKAKIDK